MDRYTSLQDWIARQFPGKAFTLSPASADASFRRYFRVTFPYSTLIAMDAPPPQEDCRPFVRVAALMADAKVHVPAVLAQDLARGFLLLSDLGATTYLAALSSGNADQLFGDAIDTLIRWQLASREGVLPAYDGTLLRRELDLFPEWYLG
ncbi:MAG: aminoglycoside phosphotransferase family protein, partial [Burkholderiales bacterium]